MVYICVMHAESGLSGVATTQEAEVIIKKNMRAVNILFFMFGNGVAGSEYVLIQDCVL